MEPELKIPHVKVTARKNDFEAEKVWQLYESPDQSDEDNVVKITSQLIDIWNYIYHCRVHGMERPFLWELHPHLAHYHVRATPTSTENTLIEAHALGNLQNICLLMEQMEKWYVPLFYGEQIIKWYVRRFPITQQGIGHHVSTVHNPFSVTMCPQHKSIRYIPDKNVHRVVSGYSLKHLCHDMIAWGLDGKVLTEAINHDILRSFVKPLTTEWADYDGDDVFNMNKLTKVGLYSSLLIATMAIMNDGRPVHNMCAIELWGATERFILDGYPVSDFDNMIHEIQRYKWDRHKQVWNLITNFDEETRVMSYGV